MTLIKAYYSRTYAKQHGFQKMNTRKGGTVSVTHLHTSPIAEYPDAQYQGLVRPVAPKIPRIAS